MPETSVVMSVKNEEAYIVQSVESILGQTYTDFEFIIIDDGSSDNTLSILRDFSRRDGRIKLISRANKGLVCSLNEGIAQSKGQFIARMDGDDIARHDRLEKQIVCMKKDPSIHILGSNVDILWDMGKVMPVSIPEMLNTPLDRHTAKETIITHWYCFAHPTWVIRRNVFDTIGCYRECLCDDFDFIIRVVDNDLHVEKLNEPLLQYRIHPNAKSKRDNRDHEGIKQAIQVKIQSVFKDCVKIPERYAIWGAGSGGAITYEVLQKTLIGSSCICFIDSFIEGQLNDIPMHKPEKLPFLNCDYVFIATEPGKKDAMEYLSGEFFLKNIRDYVCTV